MTSTNYFSAGIVDTNRLLYTPSPFARESLLYLQETGTLKALKPHKSERSNLDSYLFFVVLDGSGFLTYENEKYTVNKGECVFIDCHKPYSHYTSNNLWSLAWVHFNSTTMHGIYDKYIERGGAPAFRPENTEEYHFILSEIADIADSNDFLRDMKINSKLAQLLTLIMEMSWSVERQNQKTSVNTESSQIAILTSIMNYLENNYTQNITLDELSARFYINKYYLCRLFKSMYGDTILNHIIKLRITNAKKLLRFSDNSIEETGTLCGFDDPNYFSRVFKKVERMTPGEYRKRW